MVYAPQSLLAVVASPRGARARKVDKSESDHFPRAVAPRAPSGTSNRCELPVPLGTGGAKAYEIGFAVWEQVALYTFGIRLQGFVARWPLGVRRNR